MTWTEKHLREQSGIATCSFFLLNKSSMLPDNAFFPTSGCAFLAHQKSARQPAAFRALFA